MTVKKNISTGLSDFDDTEIVSWDPKYITGIDLIDKQHKELFIIINQLNEACHIGGDAVDFTFKESMSKMVQYVRVHFSTEDYFLKLIKFPEYEDHKKQHDTLIKSILDAAAQYNSGKAFVPNAFVRTLKDWILSHIAFYDKAYATYVAEQKKKGLLRDAQIHS